MADHPNTYRARGPIAANLSNMPADVRDAIDRPVAWRPGEVGCRVTTHRAKPGTVVGQRLFTSVEKTVIDGRDQPMVTLRVNDQHGREPVAQLEISPDAFPTFLARLIEIYRAQGGQLRPLLDAYQGNT